MKYEVDYISLTGNTEKLAKAIALALPPDETRLVDLSTQPSSCDADIYLIGFGLSKGNIPLKVMDLLEELEGKTLLFFTTGAMEPNQENIALIERKLAPFMPIQCDYRGLFLCKGEFPRSVADTAKQRLENDPEDGQARVLLQSYNRTVGHPDQTDLQNICDFVCERIGITRA